MAKLDKNKLTQLGDSYLYLAQAVGNYRIMNYNILSTLMKNRIREYHKKLIDFSDSFYAASTIFIVEDAEMTLMKINNVSKKFNEALKNVKRVQSAINAIGASVRLGASIISVQPTAIVESLMEFEKSYMKLIKEEV